MKQTNRKERIRALIFKILIRYILGYVNISVEGYYIERFINVAISKSIFLWNTKIKRTTYAEVNVGIKDFKRIKEVARKTQCRINIKSKRGIPFIMNRYRKRKIFGIFLALIICLIYMQSRFVWNIQIEGIERIKEEEMIEELKNSRTKHRDAKI